MFDDLSQLPFVDYAYPTRSFSGLVILGEAPGEREVELQQPFCGRSGVLLNAALEAVGIDRDSCLVANVFRFRPPCNDPRQFFLSAKAFAGAGEAVSRRYGKHSLGFCRSEYASELDHLAGALRSARAVLALGAVPLWATTGRQGVTAHAGQSLPCSLAVLPVIPTYHPAYILRGRPQLVPIWREHIRTAVRAAFI